MVEDREKGDDFRPSSHGLYDTLAAIGVVSDAHREVFAKGTRDRADVTVYRDRQSEVIFIDGFYGGDTVYEDGTYRKTNEDQFGKRDFEVINDTARRLTAYRPYVTGRKIVEFGCGDGAFLQAIRSEVDSCCGIELQDDYVWALNEQGLPCHKSLSAIPDGSMDSALSFHVLEHLPDPLSTLFELKRVLRPGGILVAEVPHARDLLINELKNKAFTDFTLWSQHLVLHTRESLRRLLSAAGFENIIVEGVQRYSLSNHLTWLSKGKPGGHKSVLSAIDTPDLKQAYEATLNRIDATDTLVAIARARA